MICLYTDFGYRGPYVGQLRLALAQRAPAAYLVDLMHDAPAFNPRAAGYLLAALVAPLPKEAVVLGVVDPGVGSERQPVVLEADGRCFVGPGNGLFDLVAQRATTVKGWSIDWRPDHLSSSFHGRDLFAPVAAVLEAGDRSLLGRELERVRFHPEWPEVVDEIIYIDGFGNLVTGRRAEQIGDDAVLRLGRHRFSYARTFSEVPAGEPFWYRNSMGLVEIAANSARADRALEAAIGTPITLE